MTQLTPTTLVAVEVPLDAKIYCKELFQVDGNFEILGEVTKDKITFDVEPYVKSIPSILGSGHRDYFDYCFVKDNITKTSYRFTDKNQSFYILLQSKDIYFVNPMGKLETCSKEEWEEWQSYESKIVNKVVIIKK